MPNKTDTVKNIPSWYPTAGEIVQTQRAQLDKSKREAAAFASETFRHNTRLWWKRLFGKRSS